MKYWNSCLKLLQIALNEFISIEVKVNTFTGIFQGFFQVPGHIFQTAASAQSCSERRLSWKISQNSQKKTFGEASFY